MTFFCFCEPFEGRMCCCCHFTAESSREYMTTYCVFSPGFLLYTICFLLYIVYSRGVRENMVMAPWIWAARLERMSYGNALVTLLHHLRYSYISSSSYLHKKIQGELETCFTWNYAARIIVKHFLFAVGETHFMTAVAMCKKMVVKYSLCPAEEDGSGAWGSCGLRRQWAHVILILYHLVWKSGISALDNTENWHRVLKEQCPLDFFLMKIQSKFFIDSREDAGFRTYRRCIMWPSQVASWSPRSVLLVDWFGLPLDQGLV